MSSQDNIAKVQAGFKLVSERNFEAFLAARAGSPEYQRIIPQVRQELAAVP